MLSPSKVSPFTSETYVKTVARKAKTPMNVIVDGIVIVARALLLLYMLNKSDPIIVRPFVRIASLIEGQDANVASPNAVIVEGIFTEVIVLQNAKLFASLNAGSEVTSFDRIKGPLVDGH